MLSYFLFFFYLIFLSWSLTKIRFVVNAGLGNKIIVAIFILKIIVGLVSAGIIQHNMNVDTWKYHFDALDEYHLLWIQPGRYFSNLFESAYTNGYAGFFGSAHSYWNDLKTNLVVKFISVLHVFSFGNYYVNVVLYNFLTFFGQIALFRVFLKIYKDHKRLLLITTFLLPSLLYYGSTIHKDGIIFFALGLMVFYVYQLLFESGFKLKNVLLFLLAFLTVFLFRNYVCLIMIPALIALVIAIKTRVTPWVSFVAVFLISGISFFMIPHFFPAINLPDLVVQKQAEFLNLEKANTNLQVTILEPSFLSFLQNLPQAILNGFFRPLVTDYKYSNLLIPQIIELVMYQLIILSFLIFKKQTNYFNNPFILFGLFIGIYLCVFIGYSVPVIGAIVRYRAIYLPFIITPFLCSIDFEKLKRSLFIIK